MITGHLDIADVKLSVGYVDYAEIPVQYETQIEGGFSFNPTCFYAEVCYLALDEDATSLVLWINEEEVEVELNPELVFEINNYLIELDVEPEEIK